MTQVFVDTFSRVWREGHIFAQFYRTKSYTMDLKIAFGMKVIVDISNSFNIFINVVPTWWKYIFELPVPRHLIKNTVSTVLYMVKILFFTCNPVSSEIIMSKCFLVYTTSGKNAQYYISIAFFITVHHVPHPTQVVFGILTLFVLLPRVNNMNSCYEFIDDVVC